LENVIKTTLSWQYIHAHYYHQLNSSPFDKLGKASISGAMREMSLQQSTNIFTTTYIVRVHTLFTHKREEGQGALKAGYKRKWHSKQTACSYIGWEAKHI